MDWFKLVKGYYDSGLYTVEQVRMFWDRGKISEWEYRGIIEVNL